MTTSKIRIKLGSIEVDYEGSESFLKEELPSLLAAVSDLYQRSSHSVQDEPSAPELGGLPIGDNGRSEERARIEMTTGSIAAKLNVKSGPDLILAAAARLCIVDDLAKFSRKQLIEQMRSATAYFKPTYVNNLSSSLNTLLKDGRLNEPSKDTFALTANCEKDLRNKLA
jgi:hypothetical protein